MTFGINERLEHYLAAWHLSEPRPLVQTRTSHLYMVRYESDTAVLKLLTDHGSEVVSAARLSAA